MAHRSLHSRVGPRALGTRRFWLLLAMLALALMTTLGGIPTAFAQTASTYSTPSCSTPFTSFNVGSTVYGGATGIPKQVSTVDILYVNPSSTVAQTTAGVPVSGSGVACDSAGYLLPANAPTGTWTLEVCKPGTSCSNNGNTVATIQFTVTAAVPDLPSGIFLLLASFLTVYMLMRRRSVVVKV